MATVAVAVIAAFGTGVVLYQKFAATAPHPVAAAPTIPTLTRTVPDVLPDFTLKDLAGKPHSIREWSGRPLVINFWATWCEPCRAEIPLLEKLRHERQADRLEVVGIAVDIVQDVQAFVAKTPISYPILAGEEEGAGVASTFGVLDLALPFTVFADAQGRILLVRLGQLHQDQAKLILDALKDVDSGAIDLDTAKARVAAGVRS